MFLGLQWYWWLIILLALIISLPFKLKFLREYFNKSESEKND